jgi:hypothetical protein
LIDTNVLLRWVKTDDKDYDLVQNALDALLAQGDRVFYASQNVAEFWNTCTRPVERNGFGLSLPEADRRAQLFEKRFELIADGASAHEEWRRLIVQYQVSGVRVHDARL